MLDYPSRSFATGTDSLRSRISTTDSSVMAISKPNDSEYSITTAGAPALSADRYVLAIADTSILTIWGTDSVTFSIPSNGTKYYYVTFDTSSGLHPIYSGVGGSGNWHCRCNPWHPEGDGCHITFTYVDFYWFILFLPSCGGFCMDWEADCGRQPYIIAHTDNGYVAVYGPASYLVIRAQHIWYNGVRY